MTITFTDGTRIEVAASALDNFIRHDLKWVEFVHGRAVEKQLSAKPHPVAMNSHQTVHRCPSPCC
jgi:hypothetical protein